MPEKQSLAIELVCVDLPPKVPSGLAELRLGVQAGQDVRQDVVCSGDQIIFRFPITVTADPDDGALHFSGEYVHGPRGGKFIYLCWGERQDGGWRGIRRAKLPLSAIPPELVRTALQKGQALRARIHTTDAKGSPVAASLKPGAYEWMA